MAQLAAADPTETGLRGRLIKQLTLAARRLLEINKARAGRSTGYLYICKHCSVDLFRLSLCLTICCGIRCCLKGVMSHECIGGEIACERLTDKPLHNDRLRVWVSECFGHQHQQQRGAAIKFRPHAKRKILMGHDSSSAGTYRFCTEASWCNRNR